MDMGISIVALNVSIVRNEKHSSAHTVERGWINMRLIDVDKAIEATWEQPTYTDPLNVLAEVRDRIRELPTVEAVPISFIEKRIEQLKNHADYEFEANGGYVGGSQYRQWELECLLNVWAERKEE